MRLARLIVSVAVLLLGVAVGVAAQALLSVAKDMHRLSLWLMGAAGWLVKKPADVKGES